MPLVFTKNHIMRTEYSLLLDYKKLRTHAVNPVCKRIPMNFIIKANTETVNLVVIAFKN